jgi:hypothetical protein
MRDRENFVTKVSLLYIDIIIRPMEIAAFPHR